MKKALIVSLLLVVSASIFAQSAKPIEQGVLPPKPVLKAFEKLYQEVKVSSWKLEHGKYEANFREFDRDMACIYDSSGMLLETETEMTMPELPAVVQKALEEMQPTKIEKVVTKGMAPIYEVETPKVTRYLNAIGKPLHGSVTSGS